MYPNYESVPGNCINIQVYRIIIQKCISKVWRKYPEKIMCKLRKKRICINCTKLNIQLYILCNTQYTNKQRRRGTSNIHKERDNTYTERDNAQRDRQHTHRERQCTHTHTQRVRDRQHTQRETTH